MEQIDQLKEMRDAARDRLEAAFAALEQSPDAKLVKSLTTLIEDLEESLGLKTQTAEKAKSAAKKSSKAKKDEASDANAAKAVEGAEIEPVAEEPKSGATAKPKAEEMSLEDSLEAELLGSDLGKV